MNFFTFKFFLLLLILVCVAIVYIILNDRARKVNGRLKILTNQGAPYNEYLIGHLYYLATRVIQKLIRFSLPNRDSDLEKIRNKLAMAGYRKQNFVMLYFGIKASIALGIMVIFLLRLLILSAVGSTEKISLASSALWLVIFIGIGYYLPDLFLSYRTKTRKQELKLAFPTVIDLMRVCVSAGMGVDAAIARVGAQIGVVSKVMAMEFGLVATEIRAGVTRAEAFQNLAARMDLEEVKNFAGLVAQADRYGTSISDALEAFSSDLRFKRKMVAQAEAAKISVKMSFPMIGCIFPALFIVLLAPIIITVKAMLK